MLDWHGEGDAGDLLATDDDRDDFSGSVDDGSARPARFYPGGDRVHVGAANAIGRAARSIDDLAGDDFDSAIDRDAAQCDSLANDSRFGGER